MCEGIEKGEKRSGWEIGKKGVWNDGVGKREIEIDKKREIEIDK